MYLFHVHCLKKELLQEKNLLEKMVWLMERGDLLALHNSLIGVAVRWGWVPSSRYERIEWGDTKFLKSCKRSLVWIIEKISLPVGCPGIETGCPEQWWSHHT